MSHQTDLARDLDLLAQMFSPDFDWPEWWENCGDEPDTVFRRCYMVHDYGQGVRPVGTVVCGGLKFVDTPRALYRILYLSKPHAVDFSDMYKSGSMIDLCSPDYRLCASFRLWKYEACIYFSAALELVTGQPSIVLGGWPWCDNGTKCCDALGQRWFWLLERALDREWSVYPGNNFTV